MNNQENNIIERPPVVAIMGHIDHGKSTLLDYIRKSNVVDKEAGGITQHISAYEVVHKNQSGKEKKITFLDTPGHEAFTAVRSRGANIADIAVLIVSAEEGVKSQTLEVWEDIKNSKIPFVVVITKIDKPSANIEKTKNSLLENGIYIEGYGGDIPCAEISSKTGQGMNEFLDILLLVAEMTELKGDVNKPAEGFVLEAGLDMKKGINATLIIKDGSLKSGYFVTTDESIAPVRIMENFLGKLIKEATFSSPIKIIGFDKIPNVGSFFTTYISKKEAEKTVQLYRENKNPILEQEKNTEDEEKLTIALVIKADVWGTVEAIKHEIEKIKNDRVNLKIISAGVSNISENDIKLAIGKDDSIIVGFNVKVDLSAKELAEQQKIEIQTFDIIYRLTEWLSETIKTRTPKRKEEEIKGVAKVLKTFSIMGNKQLVGCKVKQGSFNVGNQVRILRKDEEMGKGNITEMQIQRIKVKTVNENDEFGTMIESKTEIMSGDVLESFIIVEK